MLPLCLQKTILMLCRLTRTWVVWDVMCLLAHLVMGPLHTDFAVNWVSRPGTMQRRGGSEWIQLSMGSLMRVPAETCGLQSQTHAQIMSILVKIKPRLFQNGNVATVD